MLVAQPTAQVQCLLGFSTSCQFDDGTQHIERMQVRKIQLHVVQHLVKGTSIQSLRQHPIANICCCAEIWQDQVVEHGTHSIGEYPNDLFCYNVRHRMVWDCGVRFDAVTLADVEHLTNGTS
jgi:hypothetical protein